MSSSTSPSSQLLDRFGKFSRLDDLRFSEPEGWLRTYTGEGMHIVSHLSVEASNTHTVILAGQAHYVRAMGNDLRILVPDLSNYWKLSFDQRIEELPPLSQLRWTYELAIR